MHSQRNIHVTAIVSTRRANVFCIRNESLHFIITYCEYVPATRKWHETKTKPRVCADVAVAVNVSDIFTIIIFINLHLNAILRTRNEKRKKWNKTNQTQNKIHHDCDALDSELGCKRNKSREMKKNEQGIIELDLLEPILFSAILYSFTLKQSVLLCM